MVAPRGRPACRIGLMKRAQPRVLIVRPSLGSRAERFASRRRLRREAERSREGLGNAISIFHPWWHFLADCRKNRYDPSMQRSDLASAIWTAFWTLVHAGTGARILFLRGKGASKKYFAAHRAQPVEKARFGRENPSNSKTIQPSQPGEFAELRALTALAKEIQIPPGASG